MDEKELMLHPWESQFKLPDTFNMVSLLLERHLKGEDADRTAIIFQDQKTTYGQLGAMTNKVGNGLIQQGIKPGDRVIILLYDRPEFMASFLGIMKIGAVPVPINMLATTSDLEFFIKDSQAVALIMENDIYDKLKNYLAENRNFKCLITHGLKAEGTLDLSDMIRNGSGQLDIYPTSKNDPSYWLYTSGTTGNPKGVIHLHKDLVYAVETWGRHVINFTRDDCVFCTSKLFFSYGLNFSLYLPLYYGASVVLNPDRPVPETVMAMIEHYKPTGLFSVPTAYGQMINYLEERGKKPDMGSLRFCNSAGEALPGSLFQKWKALFGIEILDGLGSSEASFIFISNRPGKVRENSSGQVLPGYTIEVRDAQRQPIPAGELGDLWIKGEAIFNAYWNHPEKTAETLVNGWMKTGDMGYLDETGYFFFSARGNDTMKVSGIWVSPLEVENALLAHPAVAECAVVGMEDAMGLIKPKAFVVLKKGHQASEELVKALQLHVKQNLTPHKYPRVIDFVDELPKTSTGKIQRYKLREQPKG